MSALLLLAAAVVPAGEAFTCTPEAVWDGDGPVWCEEGLAADGCHNDRKNGGRHCHRAQAPQARERPLASGDVYYANCAAARAAGAAPVRIGDPGYARHLDRDGDGVGCE